MTTVVEWVSAATGRKSARSVAQKLSRSHSSVAAWMRDGSFPVEVILQIAREYDADALEGLVAAGYLDRDNRLFVRAVHLAPTKMLIEEMHARIVSWEEARTKGIAWTPPHADAPIPTAASRY